MKDLYREYKLISEIIYYLNGRDNDRHNQYSLGQTSRWTGRDAIGRDGLEQVLLRYNNIGCRISGVVSVGININTKTGDFYYESDRENAKQVFGEDVTPRDVVEFIIRTLRSEVIDYTQELLDLQHKLLTGEK